MPKLAVLILTYNEKNNIKECIESAQFADEIIVVDSFSNDGTQSIAKKLGAVVFENGFEEGFAAQRNFALTCTKCDWIFYLDADERITQGLAEELKEVSKQPAVGSSFEVLRQNFVLGKKMFHGVYQPDWSHRMYPRDSIKWEGIVHERPNTNTVKKRLNECLLHYTYSDWEKYFSTFNRYTTMMASEYFKKGKKTGHINSLLRAYFAFFQAYILRQGFRDGKLGLTLSVFHAFYTMVKYQKLLFLQNEKMDRGASV